jgi:replicative DNA helicase
MRQNTIEPFLVSIAIQSAEACTLIQGCADVSDFADGFHQQLMSALYQYSKTAIWDIKAFAELMGIEENKGDWSRLYDLRWSPSIAASSGYFDFKIGGIEIVEDLVKHLIDNAKRRFIERGGSELARIAKEPCVDLALLEAEIAEMQSKLTSGSERRTWAQKTSDWIARLEEKYERRHEPSSLGTGMPTLDRLISRFLPGELVIVSAKRKVGKSALMVGVVDKSSIQNKEPGLIITLEMGSGEWHDRLFAYRSGVDAQRIGEGKLLESDFPKLTNQMSAIQSAPIFCEDQDCFAIGQITSLIRYYRFKSNISYAIVDHAQLVQFPGSKNGRSDDLDKLGATLKTLAKKLGITIFLLSQTNDKGVTFGASMLEAHLNKLIRIEIPEGEDERTNIRYVNLMLNRSGKTGGVEALFDGALCRFSEVTHKQEPKPQRSWT